MAFRTVVIDSHCKLEYSLNYLVFRTSEEIKRVLLDEIHTVIVQSTAVSLTTSLLSELSSRKIKVIFCDEKHNPQSELVNIYGCHNSSKRIMEQISWPNEVKNIVWKVIVTRKIHNQALSLRRIGKVEEYNQLLLYMKEVEVGDITNREGHAAKVYFNNRYHKGFTREDDSDLNKYLNYGYTILLSCFNRCISSFGYLTQLGIHHKNEFNQFNFSCDLIEPFRFIIDDFVESLDGKEDWKDKIIDLLGKEYLIDGKLQSLTNAITIYCQSVFSAISSGDISKIKFIQNDL